MGTTRTKGLQVVFYLLIVNFIFDVVLTFINCLIKPQYLSELVSFSLYNILVFTIVLILTLIITIIPVIYGQKYKQWSEDYALKIFFKTLAIISLTIISLASIVLYFTIYTNYPALYNPFSLSNSNKILALFSPFWWLIS